MYKFREQQERGQIWGSQEIWKLSGRQCLEHTDRGCYFWFLALVIFFWVVEKAHCLLLVEIR